MMTFLSVCHTNIRANSTHHLQHTSKLAWSLPVVKLPIHRWGIPKFETTRLYVCQTRGKVSNKHKAFHPTVH